MRPLTVSARRFSPKCRTYGRWPRWPGLVDSGDSGRHDEHDEVGRKANMTWAPRAELSWPRPWQGGRSLLGLAERVVGVVVFETPTPTTGGRRRHFTLVVLGRIRGVLVALRLVRGRLWRLRRPTQHGPLPLALQLRVSASRFLDEPRDDEDLPSEHEEHDPDHEFQLVDMKDAFDRGPHVIDPAWFHGGVRVAALCVLVLALCTGGGLAFAAWKTTVRTPGGQVCGTAFHFHPGSGDVPQGGEMSEARHRANAERCDEYGAGPWRAGWIELGAGGAVAAACAIVLVVTRPRQSKP